MQALVCAFVENALPPSCEEGMATLTPGVWIVVDGAETSDTPPGIGTGFANIQNANIATASQYNMFSQTAVPTCHGGKDRVKWLPRLDLAMALILIQHICK